MNGTIIYFHGLGSAGNSEKSKQIADAYPECNIIAPDLPISPNKVIELVDQILKNVVDYPVIFVGTSLGGFWANYYAQKCESYAVLVNPSIRPDITLSPKVGETLQNYSTGKFFTITETDIQEYQIAVAETLADYNGHWIHLFCAKDDTVIDCNIAVDTLKYFNTVNITPDGGHRYTNHWDKVIDKIGEVLSKS